METKYVKVKIQAIDGDGAIFELDDMFSCNVNQFGLVSADEIKNKLKEVHKNYIFYFPKDELGHIDWTKITDAKVIDVNE